MIDSYIANATVDESVTYLFSFAPLLNVGYSLRCAVRGLLSSGTSGIASAFSAAARKHLQESGGLVTPDPKTLFTRDLRTGEITPTNTLAEVLARARTVYGVGMGFASLELLIPAVEATIGAKWTKGSYTEEVLTEIDADIVQAIQSCKEELEADPVKERSAARQIVSKLHRAIRDSSREGALPFEKAEYSIQYWKF
jgi:hypothetical protein